MIQPKISVIFPVRNSQPYLQEAIRSILTQTYQNFEVVCIDDGSSDSGTRLLDSIHDPRWTLIRHQTSIGLTASLNEGLGIAQGTYIARMDGDDVCYKKRFAEQVRFLENNRAIDVVGSWAKTIGTDVDAIWKYPADGKDIQAEMLFNSTLIHSTVMMRRSTLVKKRLQYDARIERAQDYELWTRPGSNLRLANLPSVLVHYRVHSGQIGRSFSPEQQKTANFVRERQLRLLGLKPSSTQLRLHNRLSLWNFGKGENYLAELQRWFLDIDEANQQTGVFDRGALRASLQRRWISACRSALSRRKSAWATYAGSPIATWAAKNGRVDKAFFWAKAQLWR